MQRDSATAIDILCIRTGAGLDEGRLDTLMPDKESKKRGPATSRKASPKLTEDEWKAYGSGEPLPPEVERCRREREIKLAEVFYVGQLPGRYWDYTLSTIAERLLSRLTMLPDEKWRRVLHLLTTTSGRGRPAAGGLHIVGKGGRERDRSRDQLLARLDDALRERTDGESVLEVALRVAGSSEGAASLLNARKWRDHPRRRKGVQPKKK